MSRKFFSATFVASFRVRHSWIESALAVTCLLACANSLFAATVAHWDFETDLIAGSAVNGQVVSHPSANGAFDAALADLSGNGNHLSAFAQNGSFTAMRFSNIVAPVNRTNTTLSIENAPGTCCPVLSSQDDLEVGGVNVGAMSAWTIEATVNFKDLGAWRTIVGKDGVGQATNGDVNQAPLYFQKKGDGTQQFRINYVDAAGYVHIVDSTTAAAVNTWYHVVATNDGSTMKIYVNNVLENSLDLTASPSPNRAMAALDEAGFAGTGTDAPYAWTVARGMYNDGHGDRVDGFIDDVRISNLALDPSTFLNRPPDLLPSTLRINRDTGAMTLLNQQAPIQIVGYSITSTAGSLNSANWQTIANNFDATSGGEFDADDEWTVLSAAGSKTDFSEFVFDTTPGNGGALGSSFQVPIGAAGAWRKSIFEDVQAVLKKSDGSTVAVNLEYTGHGGQPFDRSDLNFDNVITGADWVIFRTNNLANLSSMTLAEAYAKGDLDGDRDSDVNDFRLFKADWEAANPGAGSFAQMIASVPEPTTAAMLLGGILLLGCRRGRRTLGVNMSFVSEQLSGSRLAGRVMATVAALMICMFVSTAHAARTHTYTFNAGNVNDSTSTANGALAGAANVSALGQLVLPGAGADFATLPASTIAINTYTDATFEAWMTRTGAGGAWQRLFDFGDTNVGTGFGRNYIFYSPNSGPGDNRAVISDTDPGFNSEDVAVAGPVLSASAEHHVVVRFDSASNGGSGMMDVFVDGALGGSVLITKQLSVLSNNLAYLGESTYPGDTNLNGSVNEFRLYNHALSNTEITDNNYFGATPSNLLGLEVNKTTGAVTLRNNHSADLTIDHYQIVSRGGALNASWSGLGSLDSIGAGEGESWAKAGGSNSSALAELFLAGSSTFNPSESASIGTAFNPAIFGAGNNGDLVFRFKLSTGEQLQGPVTYLTGAAVSGDYSGNGVVDAADYTFWRDRLGQNSPLPNTNPADVDGVVTQAEYTYWKSRFGATSGSGGGGVTGSSAVPEPTAMLLLTLGAGVGLVASYRRSRISTPHRRDTMSNITKGFGVRSIVSALALVAVLGTAASAATKDRFYQFGDDTTENPVIGQPPASDFGPFTVDSAAIGPNDFSDLSYSNGPVYVNTNTLSPSRPGSAAGELGLTFNGTSHSVFRTNGGLGSPAIGDDDGAYAGNPNYTGIMTRLIDGWVRPTNLALGRQDIVNDTAQFGVFVSADDMWGLVHGATTITSTTAVTANAWAHVMHRTFTNTAGALYVNGVAVAATNNDYNAGAAAGNIVFGANLDQSANYFAGQLDNFSIYVAGNNSAEVNGANWGDVNLATDNDFIRQQLVGKLAGDVNLSGGVPNATDVSVFVANWRSAKVVNGVTIGDITTRTKGDLDFDGDVDIDDAFSLHAALLGAGAGGLDFSLLGANVPEPGSLFLAACGCAALAIRTRRQRSEPGRGYYRAAMVGPRA